MTWIYFSLLTKVVWHELQWCLEKKKSLFGWKRKGGRKWGILELIECCSIRAKGQLSIFRGSYQLDNCHGLGGFTAIQFVPKGKILEQIAQTCIKTEICSLWNIFQRNNKPKQCKWNPLIFNREAFWTPC